MLSHDAAAARELRPRWASRYAASGCRWVLPPKRKRLSPLLCWHGSAGTVLPGNVVSATGCNAGRWCWARSHAAEGCVACGCW